MPAYRPPADLSLTIAVGALLAVFAFGVWPWRLAVIACGLGWAMLAIALSDARHFRIPDVFSLPMTVVGLLATHWIEPAEVADHVLATGIAAASLWLVRAGYARARGREGLGLGDVKLAAVAGAWLGTAGLAPTLLLASLAALIFVAGLAIFKGATFDATSRIPFGVFLAPAIWLVFAIGNLAA